MNEIRIIWRLPDGTIAVTCPAPGVSLDEAAARALTSCPVLHDAVRLPDRAALELPDEAQRHAWRADAEGRLFVDATVPAPPAPRDLAAEVDALKAEIAKMRTP